MDFVSLSWKADFGVWNLNNSSDRLSHSASLIFSAVSPCPHLAFSFLGQVRKRTLINFERTKFLEKRSSWMLT